MSCVPGSGQSCSNVVACPCLLTSDEYGILKWVMEVRSRNGQGVTPVRRQVKTAGSVGVRAKYGHPEYQNSLHHRSCYRFG